MKSDTDQPGTTRLAAQNQQKLGPGLHKEGGKWKRLLFQKLLNDVALFISLDNAGIESLKRERALPPPGSVKTELGGCFSLLLFVLSPDVSRALQSERHCPGAARGKAASSQHRRRGSARALAASFSEKLGRLRAKLFSKSDPYLGAFQEAEVFRNPAASTETGPFGEPGQGLCDETADPGALCRREVSALSLFVLCTAAPAQDRPSSPEQAAEANAPAAPQPRLAHSP